MSICNATVMETLWRLNLRLATMKRNVWERPMTKQRKSG